MRWGARSWARWRCRRTRATATPMCTCAGEGAAQPRLALTCSGAHGAVWWFADGDLLGQAPADQPCWWLAPGGRHDLRVVDASGRAASVHIKVR